MSIETNAASLQADRGKSRSSRNATKYGLFNARDFIREGEEKEYAQSLSTLMTELSPEGVLEQTFATEIMGAAWRLRRCRMAEHQFVSGGTLDPMVDEVTSIGQKSVDRARAQSHHLLRRSIAELRKLQTERTMRIELDAGDVPGLTDCRQVLDAVRSEEKPRPGAAEPGASAAMDAVLDRLESSFCKPKPQPVPQPSARENESRPISRNVLCPCGSGTKYKRCCGKGAPPSLNKTQ
jgi:hypothetical protein